MALVSEKPKQVYDLSKIKAGWLFYGRHKTWEEGKAGIVTSAREDELVVQYYPGIANVTNHFIIPAAEVYAGEWEIRWSADMAEVYGDAGQQGPKPDSGPGTGQDMGEPGTGKAAADGV